MISPTFILLALLTIGLARYLVRRNKWKNPPPGPKGLPIVGNLLQLEPLQHKSYVKWAKEFGPIYKLNFINKRMLVLSDHKLVKEAFSLAEFSGRMDFSQFEISGAKDGQRYGIAGSEGSHWEELRRFTLRQLRDFGFGKASMEDSIMIEVNELMEGFQKNKGTPINNFKDRLHFAVVNALWAIVTGKRYGHDDKELLELTKAATDSFNDIVDSTGPALLFVPELGKIAPEFSGYNKIMKSIKGFEEYFRTPIKEHVKTFDDSYLRDFIDVFLNEMKKTKDSNSAFHGERGEHNLITTLNELYRAGTDTTSTTLTWVVLYLSKMPYIQKKMQEEIDDVVGNCRAVSLTDRPSMPYTEAVITETLRYSSLVPQGVQHRTTKDVEFHGYFIPKDTIVMANQYHIHYDPKIWGDPLNFRPERFLSPDGKTFKKHEALVPFSVGRRQCLGESLARDNLFLFTANMFQKFNIEFDTTGPDHGFEPKIEFALVPNDYRVFANERFSE